MTTSPTLIPVERPMCRDVIWMPYDFFWVQRVLEILYIFIHMEGIRRKCKNAEHLP